MIGSFGQKIIAGNHFIWGEVAQFYGNTLLGVFADNLFESCNVLRGGGNANGALQGTGECYHGPVHLNL